MPLRVSKAEQERLNEERWVSTRVRLRRIDFIPATEENGVDCEVYELLDMGRDRTMFPKRLTPCMATPQITYDEKTATLRVYRAI